MFAEKLILLMNVQGITSRQLAQALHVDSSLVSRWRKGGRVPAAGSHYLRELSHFFAQNAVQDYQKSALIVAMGLPQDQPPGSTQELAEHILRWLNESFAAPPAATELPRYVKSFLGRMDLADDSAYFQARQNAPEQYLSAGEALFGEVYQGYAGIKSAWLRLLRAIEDYKQPTTLYSYSDQTMEWIDNDPEYDLLWCAQLMRCIEGGLEVKIIHATNREPNELFALLERWVPFYITGKVEAYYCPRNLDSTFRRAMVAVPGVGCLVANTLNGTEVDSEFYLYFDARRTDYLLRQFQGFLRLCSPLVRTFRPGDIRAYQNIHIDFVNSPEENISLLHTLSSVTMSQDVFLAGLDEMKLSNYARKGAVSLFKLKAEIFQRNLAHHSYTEILNLPPPEQFQLETLPMNYVPYFGKRTIYYTPQLFNRHLTNLIALLEAYPHYHLYLKRNVPFHNIQLASKENTGIMFTKEYNPYLNFAMYQPNLVSAFYRYLANMVQTMPEAEKERGYVIDCLKQYFR